MLWKLSATELSTMLARGDVSARDILRAHLDRIDEVEGRVRAFTEVLRDRAMAEAVAADERRARGRTRGALDGVPVTFKECFDMAGHDTTLGLPSWRGRHAQRESVMVTLLREAGAVVLGRTNLSQTMLYAEAKNPVFGQTSNPWSLAHSPGGSSGGEGAAIAAGMSPLGVGTDIGGSIRTPAHFCGIAGFKPSLDRLPMRGYQTVNAGQEGVRAMCGPMARKVADLELFLRALDMRRAVKLDPRVPPLAWEAVDRNALVGLRVGTYTNDGVLPASTAIGRAVERATDALQSHGCEIRSFRPDVRGLLAAYFGALSADGGADIRAALAGGEVDPSLEGLRRLALLPAHVRRAASSVSRMVGQGNLALLLDSVGAKSVSELWQTTEQLRNYRIAFLEQMDRDGVDALVCPVYATPAFTHGASKGFVLASSYSMVFNAMQFPAGAVPVTRVREAETDRARGRDRLVDLATEVDAQSAGLPVGVQVVGRPWEDSVVLALMGAIEAEVSADQGYPLTPVGEIG